MITNLNGLYPSIYFSFVKNTAKPEDFDRIRTLGTGKIRKEVN